jgi:D-alanyl-D-alanine carboxypeptidase
MKKYLLLLFLFMYFIPNVVFAEELVPNGESSILIEANTGKILFEKEKDKKVSVASMTKMVAQIIILEEIENNKIKWDDVVTASRNASGMGGSQIYLEEGEKMTVRDLMKGISVASANDATVAMAEYISGTEEKFVKRMNNKVKELGLVNTNFMNCTGLDEENHYSTAYDMALLMRYAMENEIFFDISTKKSHVAQTLNKKYYWQNKHKLVTSTDYVISGKTGYTKSSGRTLVSYAVVDNMKLIAVSFNESSDFELHKLLFENARKDFTNERIIKKGVYNQEINTLNYYPYIKKHGYFMLGYKCDSEGNLKYIVYGVPGKKDKDEQPYDGKTGFVTWVSDKDSDEVGCWLMFYDYKNSTVVVPMQ